LGLVEIPEPSDAADALAVALCHLQSEQFRARFAVPVEVARRVSVARAAQVVPTGRPQNSARVKTVRQALPSQ
jgi:hypothetical protein